MSQISKALIKMQEQREERQQNTQKIEENTQPKPQLPEMDLKKDTPQSNSRLMMIVAGGFLSVILVNARLLSELMLTKNEMQSLMKKIEQQEGKIDTLTELINNTRTASDKQINDLSAQLDRTNEDLRNRLTALMQNTNDQFAALKKSAVDDEQQLNTLMDTSKEMGKTFSNLQSQQEQLVSQIQTLNKKIEQLDLTHQIQNTTEFPQGF